MLQNHTDLAKSICLATARHLLSELPTGGLRPDRLLQAVCGGVAGCRGWEGAGRPGRRLCDGPGGRGWRLGQGWGSEGKEFKLDRFCRRSLLGLLRD